LETIECFIPRKLTHDEAQIAHGKHMAENGGTCPLKRSGRAKDCPYARPNGHTKGSQIYMTLDQQIHRTDTINDPRYFPRPSPKNLNILNATDMYQNIIIKDKYIISENPTNFYKEHEKYLSFLNIYGSNSIAEKAKEIIVIGMGATLEWDEFKEQHKNEVCTFIEHGWTNKLKIIGLKGNGKSTLDMTKDVKYRMALNIGIKDNNITRAWIDDDTPKLVPYSLDDTLILVVVDGNYTTVGQFELDLQARRPNSTIDFFVSRNKSIPTLEKLLNQPVKRIFTYTKPTPTLWFCRIKHKGLNT